MNRHDQFHQQRPQQQQHQTTKSTGSCSSTTFVDTRQIAAYPSTAKTCTATGTLKLKSSNSARYSYSRIILYIISFGAIFGNVYLSLTFEQFDEQHRSIRTYSNMATKVDSVIVPSRPYPRWGSTIAEEQRSGIELGPVLDFIVNSSVAMYISQQSNSSLRDKRYRPTSDHKDDVGYWLPETVYMLDHNGLSTSLRHRLCNAYGKGVIKDKVVPTERMIMSAIQYLKNQSDSETTCKKWPNLCRILLLGENGNQTNESTLSSSGFPFLVFYGDFTGCNYHNYKGNLSIPIFTAAARVDCNHAFPFITHELLEMTREKESEWDKFFAVSKRTYPWRFKKSQVLWRGALTGRYVNDTYKNARWNLLRTIHKHHHEFMRDKSDNNDNNNLFMFDAGAVRLPLRQESKHWINDIDSEIGGFVGRIDPMERYQKYRAILDIDGHSWSSRFNLLLCYNSVVLKVEPRWVDLLQYSQRNTSDDASHLQPWKHYIPIKADLSDLFDIASFVVDPSNDELLLEIIKNANDWCRNSLVKRSVQIDILNIFERYVELIDIGNPNWRERQWRSAKETILDKNSTLRMKVLTMDEDIYYGQEDVLAYKKAYGVPIL